MVIIKVLVKYLLITLILTFCTFPWNNSLGESEGYLFEGNTKVELKEKEKEINCITRLLWYEARGESKEGIKAVLSVVKNRTEHPKYPGSYCKVEQQPKQFSYFKKGRAYKIKPKNSTEETKLDYIQNLAYDAVHGRFDGVLPSSVIFYMRKELDAKRYLQVRYDKNGRVLTGVEGYTSIGTHRFYREVN